MSQLETIRVRHPTAPGQYMVINKADRQSHHEDWHEQAPGGRESVVIVAPAAAPPAAAAPPGSSAGEVQASLSFAAKLVANKLGMRVAELQLMHPDERAALIRSAEAEFDAYASRPPEPQTTIDGDQNAKNAAQQGVPEPPAALVPEPLPPPSSSGEKAQDGKRPNWRNKG